jgi:beta-galactosidase/beta-glucuronidase
MTAPAPLELAERHPRPQCTRACWTELDGPWGFAYDDDDVGLRAGWHAAAAPFTRQIIVPFPPESAASGIGDPSFHPIVWYRRVFTHAVAGDAARRGRRGPRHTTAERARDARLLLHFGAVDYRAQVWVNGQLVATHEGGQTPFSADITGALRADSDEQTIVVRAEDRPDDLAQPRGKQYWEVESRGIWHGRTTGIWQPVWLEPVNTLHIAGIRWTPDADRVVLGLAVTLNTPPARPLRLRVRLRHDDVLLADDTYTQTEGELRREITLASGTVSLASNAQRLFWTPENPNLIAATITLLDGETTIDEVGSYAGLRSIGISKGQFQINGRPYYQRLVLQQGYWPESHLAAPCAAALRREVELVKELGFNGVRIHQKVEDPRFLFWCDRLGLLVWGEMANAFVFSTLAIERLTREWLDVVRRDYSHPCIVTWMPLNESWGVHALPRDPAQQHYVQALYHLTHAVDPTRPVIGNDGWEQLANDIWGIHDYTPHEATLRERYGTPEALARLLEGIDPAPLSRIVTLAGVAHAGQPVILTEFGGISYAPARGERWFGYDTVPDAEQYFERYAEYIEAILDCPTIFGFCYTQLTDTAQETNGLLTADRQHKLDPARVRTVNSAPSKAYPAEVTRSIQQRVRERTGERASEVLT